MLTMRHIMGQGIVIKVIAAKCQIGHADAAIKGNTDNSHEGHDFRGRDLHHFFQAVDNAIEDERRRDNHTGLKAASGAEITMKLNIKPIENDGGEQNFRTNTIDRV